MFSVYGETGRVFKGAMEDLWHVEAVRAIARSRAVRKDKAFSLPAQSGLGAEPAEQPPAAAASPAAAYAQVAQPQRHPLSRVSDVMSHAVITVRSDMTVRQAWEALAQHGVAQAPVIDAQTRLVGLFSRAELLRPERLPQAGSGGVQWQALLAQPVATLMWSPVPAVSEQTEIRRVAQVLLQTELPGLVVVADEGEVCGFISRSDILRAVVHDPPLDLWT